MRRIETPPREVAPGLQTIFAIFLGLMVTACAGVGLYTFYPSPDRVSNDRMLALNRQELAIRNAKAPDDLTAGDRQRIQQIQDELAQLEDARRVAREAWGRRTSIALITLATVAMMLSLARSVQLPAISNGLLLGGVFTMVYGVGWIIVTDGSMARFFVMTVALAITLALGYVRFVREPVRPGVPADQPAIPAGAQELEQRVRALEERMASAAQALGLADQPRRRPPSA
jgi:hypothetical protein